MPRARTVDAAAWRDAIDSQPEFEAGALSRGHVQALAALGLSPANTTWIAKRLAEVAAVLRVAATPAPVTVAGDLARVRAALAAAEEVERVLRDPVPSPGLRIAAEHAQRAFRGREVPAVAGSTTALGASAGVVVQSLRKAERELVAESKRGRPRASVARMAVDLVAPLARRIAADDSTLVALAAIVLDEAGVPAAGRSRSVLSRYVAARG